MLVTVMLSTPPSWAETYPSHPVQFIVGYPQGGAGEVAAGITEELAATLGQPVKVEYRPGASGAIAAESVARAAPDGYTLLLGQTPELVINVHLIRDLGYNPRKDLQPVALLIVMPLALVVHSTAPYDSVGELVKAARESQRGLLYASAGTGTAGQFAGELLRLRSVSRLNHVPNDGAGPALRDVIDGRVDFSFVPLPVALPHVSSGEVKILAVSTAERSSAAPNVPTVAEAGYKDFDITAWVGVFAPRGTPKQVVGRLNKDINHILSQPEVRQRLLQSGADVAPMSPDQLAEFVRSETVKYRKLIDEEFCSKYGYGGCLGYSAVTYQ
jgi:tripartite-type tricarboxylate transporter receptor subunit TctC